MESMREVLFYFLLYGYLGWVLECLYASFKNRHWTKRRGVLTHHFLPLYGLCGVFIVMLFAFMPYPLFAAITAGFLISVIEYFVGWWLDKGKGFKLWDYTEVWGNVDGYICVPFTVIWMGLAYVLGYLIQPQILQWQSGLALGTQWGLIGIGTIGFMSDFLMMLGRDPLA
ncbi:MAG: putative ABC transporter permease [Cellulosilyticaceae bacterium]